MLLDVPNHQVGAGEMVHLGRHPGVVHGVGEVAHQGDLEPVIDQLADAEGAAEDAHIRMHPHDKDVPNAAMSKQVYHLDPIAYGVLILHGQRLYLAAPGLSAPAFRGAGAAAVVVLDRERPFGGADGFGPPRPGRVDGGSLEGPLPPRIIDVEPHRVARCVDDEYSP